MGSPEVQHAWCGLLELHHSLLDLHHGLHGCRIGQHLTKLILLELKGREGLSHEIHLRSHDFQLRSHDFQLRSHDFQLRSHDFQLRSHDIQLRSHEVARICCIYTMFTRCSHNVHTMFT